MLAKKSRKGFTLVELLAVIIIIAIISLITILVVTNTIESSRQKAFEDEVIIAYKNIDDYILENDLKENELSANELNSNFISGKFIEIDGKTEALYITNGRYCAKGTIDKLRINKKCYRLDDTKAILNKNLVSYRSDSRSIEITLNNMFAVDEESGIKKYIISIYDGEELIDEKTSDEIGTFLFDRLTHGKTYNTVIEVINGNDITARLEKEITTTEIMAPEYAIIPTGWAYEKTVTIDYHDTNNKYIHEYSLDSGDTFTPYTEAISFTENETIIARVNDGINFISGSSQTISEIDTTPPSAANFTYTTTTDSITVTAFGSEDGAPITRYQFSKDNVWSEIQVAQENGNCTTERCIYTFNNLTTGTYNIKIRVINDTYGNEGLNEDNYRDSTSKQISTTPSTAPTCTISPNGWQQSKTVTIDYHDTNGIYKHLYQKDNGDWVEVNENTTTVTFNATGTVKAKTVSNDNEETYIDTNPVCNVTQIDTTPPSASASIGTRTTTSVVVNATCSDDSNITKIEYKKDSGSWVDNGTTASYTFTGLSQGTSYSFKVRCTNGVSLDKESSSVTGVTKATAVFNGNGGSNGTSITADVGAQLGTLPQSSRSYTITYDLNSTGCSKNKSSDTVSYTHNGWYTATSGGTKISSSTTMPAGGVTYYAQWTSSSTTLATITKTGYTCTWNTKANGTGTSYASGKTSYTPSSTHTLYARRSPITYTISYTMNGGTNNSSNPTSYTIESSTINLANPTWSGHHFDGWSPSSSIAPGSTGNKTFTAAWSDMCGSNKVISSYGSWGSCSKKCGEGQHSRTIYYVSRFDSNYSCGTGTETGKCEEHTCCGNGNEVISGYGSWSSCSAVCDGTRTRDVYYVSKWDSNVSCGTVTKGSSEGCSTQTCSWHMIEDYTTADNCWYGISAYNIPSCYTNCVAKAGSNTLVEYTCNNSTTSGASGSGRYCWCRW